MKNSKFSSMHTFFFFLSFLILYTLPVVEIRAADERAGLLLVGHCELIYDGDSAGERACRISVHKNLRSKDCPGDWDVKVDYSFRTINSRVDGWAVNANLEGTSLTGECTDKYYDRSVIATYDGKSIKGTMKFIVKKGERRQDIEIIFSAP